MASKLGTNWGVGLAVGAPLLLLAQINFSWLALAITSLLACGALFYARSALSKIESEREKLASLATELEIQAKNASGVREDFDWLLAETAQISESNTKTKQDLTAELENQTRNASGVRHDFDSLVAQTAQLSETNAKTTQDLELLLAKTQVLNKIIASMLGQSRVVPESPSIEWMNETFAAVENRIAGNNSLLYLNHIRRFTRADATGIAEYWGPRLGLELIPESVGYVADRICQIERACVGRVAGHIVDSVIRALVLQACVGQQAKFLEIGSLFGVNAVAMMDLSLPHFEKIHCTAIDPLNGYYGKEVADISTGLPVNENIFVHNFHIQGFTSDRYNLIQKFSTDPEVIADIGQEKFDLLFIDGDHSFDGVKNDFENYHRSVKPAGYIIFDDYGSPAWDDVKVYVDDEVRNSDLVEEVGIYGSTAVFRKN